MRFVRSFVQVSTVRYTRYNWDRSAMVSVFDKKIGEYIRFKKQHGRVSASERTNV
jgi:hypothetical protein